MNHFKIPSLLIHKTTWMNLKDIMLSGGGKPNSKGYIIDVSISTAFLKLQNYRNGNQISIFQGVGREVA